MSAISVLNIRQFRNFIFARLFFTFAVNMQGTIVAWQVYEYTKDSFALGAIGLAEVIPFVLVAIFGGHIADIISRKKIIAFSASLYVLCAVALWVLSSYLTQILDTKGVLPIFIIIFITGIARGFLAPAQSAFMAQLIPKDQYANSATINSVVWHTSAIGGPVLGAWLYAFGHASLTYLVVAILGFIGLALYMIVPSQAIPDRIMGETLTTRLSAGLKFVFGHQIMLGAMALDMFAVLFGGAVALLPIFAEDVLHTGVKGLGLLRMAPAVGALLAAIFMIFRPPLTHAGRNLLICVAAFGVCTIGFALSENFMLSFILLALTGLFDNVSVVIRTTILQLYTPDDMRGRVSAVNSIFISSSNEFGAFESGTMAKIMGLVPSVIFGGGMTILVVLVTTKIAPILRSLNLHKDMNKDREAALLQLEIDKIGQKDEE